jgi:hypothetical protein
VFAFFIPYAYHLHQNLIEKKEVAANVFACLYQGPGPFILQLCQADGTFVNPTRMGFELQNLTWNCRILEMGAGENVSFVILVSESYILWLHGKEVWSYHVYSKVSVESEPLSKKAQVSYDY